MPRIVLTQKVQLPIDENLIATVNGIFVNHRDLHIYLVCAYDLINIFFFFLSSVFYTIQQQ